MSRPKSCALPLLMTVMFYIAFYGVSVGLQILILVAIIKHLPSWKTKPGVILILSLAVSDLCGCARGFLGSIEHLTLKSLFPRSDYIFGALGNLAWGCSSIHMILLSYNRFIYIALFCFDRVNAKRYAGAKITIKLCAIFWSVSLFYMIVHAVFICCPVVWDLKAAGSRYESSSPNATNYMGIFDVYGIVYPTTLIPTVFYVAIFGRLLKQKLETGQQESSTYDLKLCFQFAVILAVYLTMNIAWYAVPVGWMSNRILSFFSSFLLGLNFALNPLVYICFNESIRNAVCVLIRINKGKVAPKKVEKSPVTQKPSHVSHHLSHTDVPIPIN